MRPSVSCRGRALSCHRELLTATPWLRRISSRKCAAPRGTRGNMLPPCAATRLGLASSRTKKKKKYGANWQRPGQMRGTPKSFAPWHPLSRRRASEGASVNDVCDIFWHEGGDWVRAYIARHAGHHTVHDTGGGAGAQTTRGRRPNRNRFVRWSSAELYDQVLLWFRTARSDKRAFYEAESVSAAASIRARARTFRGRRPPAVIPAVATTAAAPMVTGGARASPPLSPPRLLSHPA